MDLIRSNNTTKIDEIFFKPTKGVSLSDNVAVYSRGMEIMHMWL
jgi:hypothetical protein